MGTVYRSERLGVEITVSRQAERLIGAEVMPQFLKRVDELMLVLGCHRAYVSKAGAAVEIHVLKRGDDHE